MDLWESAHTSREDAVQTDIDALRQADEPLRRALAMAQAIVQLLADLEHDDPGDDEPRFARRLSRAHSKGRIFLNALERLNGGTK